MEIPESRNWILRIARIAERNDRSLYSYMFYPGQYSLIFELACENLFQDILDAADPTLVSSETADDVNSLREDVFDPFSN